MKSEIKSPVRAKDLEGRFHVLFKTLVGADGSRRELFDTDKMVTIDIKKGSCIALIDENGRFWELCKNDNGRHSFKRLDKDEETGERDNKRSFLKYVNKKLPKGVDVI